MALSVSEAVSAIPSLGDYISGIRTAFINRNGFLYACDYEARLNLDIISSVKIENFKDMNITSAVFRKLIDSFQIEATQASVFNKGTTP